jgi:hypothetical protein
MSRTEILDAMREITWTIEFYKSKAKDNKSLIKKYIDLSMPQVVEMFKKRIQTQERLVRILEIRFEKLKKQL